MNLTQSLEIGGITLELRACISSQAFRPADGLPIEPEACGCTQVDMSAIDPIPLLAAMSESLVPALAALRESLAHQALATLENHVEALVANAVGARAARTEAPQ